MIGVPPDGDDVPSLPRFSLTTRGLTTAAGLERWREVASPGFDISVEGDGEGFGVAFEAFHFGTLVLVGARGDGFQRLQRTARKVEQSGIDHIVVLAYVGGRSSVDTAHETFGVGPGDIWMFDLGRPLRMAGHDFANISLTIPRPLLAPLVADVDALHGLRLAAGSPLGGLLFDHLCALAARAPDMTPHDAAAAADVALHVIAGCIGPAYAAAGPVAERIAEAVLARLRRGIEDCLADPDLGPDLLMRRHGLSRTALYRLFAPYGGVAEYIRERRLRRCHLDLVSPARTDERIAEIAKRWGFGNEAAFARAFKQRYGMTAGDARRAGVAHPAIGEAAAAVELQPMERWMRDLMSR